MRVLVQLFTLVLLVSCSSLNQKANKAFESGNYDEAIELFTESLQENAADGEAKHGLQKARQAWIDTKLIEVRMLRLSNNISDSESLLQELLYKQGIWRTFPTGVAFATQAEEILFYSNRQGERIAKAIQMGNPILAKHNLEKSKFILQKFGKTIEKWEVKIYQTAKRFCNKMFREIKNEDYYTDAWLRQTCSLWEIKLPIANRKNSVEFFQSIQVNNQIDNIDADLVHEMEQKISKLFEKSKWYSENSQNSLSVTWKGQLQSASKQTPVSREYKYPYQVPYEDSYKRTIRPPASSTLGKTLDLIFELSSDERLVDNGDGTETVYVTRYRTEYGYKKYKAIELQQKIELDSKMLFSLAKEPNVLAINAVYDKTFDQHNVNFPELGITPQSPELLSDNEWVGSMTSFWGKLLLDEIERYWVRSFCTLKEGSLSKREQMLRCGYQLTSDVPLVLDSYFQDTWGLSYSEWSSLIDESGE